MKNFTQWNRQKQDIHENESILYFGEREIWFCRLGANIGYEQDGKGSDFERPILIFKKFNNHVFWGIPLTSSQKTSKFYFEFSFKNKKSWAILSQIRLLDKKDYQENLEIYQKKILLHSMKSLVYSIKKAIPLSFLKGSRRPRPFSKTTIP
jgi:hypothetical protein